MKGAGEKRKKIKWSAETIKKRTLALKKYYSTNPLERKKVSVWIKKYYANPQSKEKASKIRKKYYQEHPQAIKEMDRIITRWWHEHPNIKKERSIAAKKLFIEHPEKFKKFIQYGNNPNRPRFRTKQGFIVKSRGEQQIANFLANNKIKSDYEKYPLIFKEEGQICIPDFYLPSYKIYIEFYGGFPKAWKKKVMKNKLYKKYKIPCIFITPAELRDLNNYLMGELKGKKF